MSREGREPRSRVPDRYVVVVAGIVVAAVLGLLALSVWVPPVGQALALAPILIVVLVVVTAVVLIRAITARAP